MADAPVVHIGENSPEEVAYKLFHHIASVERKSMHANPAQGWSVADRQWILDTYAACMVSVKDPFSRTP